MIHELPLPKQVEAPKNCGYKAVRYVVSDSGCFDCVSHALDPSGYVQKNQHIGGKQRRIWMHRYVYEQTFGVIPQGLVVRHTCDNRRCINPAHLVLGTHKDNSADAIERGRVACGERCPHAKLTATQVLEILASPEVSAKALGERYGVGDRTIRDARRGRTWKHVRAAR